MDVQTEPRVRISVWGTAEELMTIVVGISEILPQVQLYLLQRLPQRETIYQLTVHAYALSEEFRLYLLSSGLETLVKDIPTSETLLRRSAREGSLP